MSLADTDQDWGVFEDRYRPFCRQLHQCLAIARSAGATCIVVETRYYDADYRSEYAALYSRLYENRESTTHRLHFFKTDLSGRPLWDLGVVDGTGDYLGYVVVRPSALSRVGRTVLVPPPEFALAVRTAITDEVTLFGQPFHVRGAPFMQQDAVLNRCAHVAAWMAHYSAFRRREVARRPVAEFSLRAMPSQAGRQAPSSGLWDQQLVELLRQMELPPHVIDVRELRPPHIETPNAGTERQGPAGGLVDQISTLEAFCCRYLNSGFPVIVATDHHTFVLCGYDRISSDEEASIRFIRHDDNVGPYVAVASPYLDPTPGGESYSPWRTLIVPVPEEIWLQPEMAERAAIAFLNASVASLAGMGGKSMRLSSLLAEGNLALRTYATHNNDFKSHLVGRIDDPALRTYRLARLPRFIWVVEVVDRRRRAAGDAACVVGEFVFDAISGLQPLVLASHLPDGIIVFEPNGDVQSTATCGPNHYYPSGGIGPA